MTHAIEAEVRHELIIITKLQTHKTDIVLHPETVSVLTRILFLHKTLDHDTTTTKEIHDHTVLLTDLLTDLLIDTTLVIDIDHVHIQEITTISQDTQRRIDHLQDHEVLLIPDHVHLQIPEKKPNTIQSHIKLTQLTLKYTCITQLRWHML